MPNRGQLVHFYLQRNEKGSILNSSIFWPTLPNKTLANLNSRFKITSIHLAKNCCNRTVLRFLSLRVCRDLQVISWHKATYTQFLARVAIELFSRCDSLKAFYVEEDKIEFLESFVEFFAARPTMKTRIEINACGNIKKKLNSLISGAGWSIRSEHGNVVVT
ncbi:hypothetical protein L596_015738 [Steinernema carpocapsae]|uniref:F-box domain-containing protein n=1 Tax=Steinernema carpocapsae TaxID=34508 RepID=A0A4V6A373_STECR|nr:hypothetical protein L596_015738 [Steinernema carpocapsae]